MNKEIKIRMAVMLIISDLSDRSGIGDEWEQIDSFTQGEIEEEWCEIIRNALKPKEQS